MNFSSVSRRLASVFTIRYMNVIHNAAELKAAGRKVCVAIGVFDGVHLGHQQVIRHPRPPFTPPLLLCRRDRHYSGRRKRCTIKNVVVTAGGRVVLVTPTPHKKPRGRPLHWRHRRANRELARERVPVEHALAQAKAAVRKELAEAAHEIAALSHACATELGLDAIAKRTDLSLSDVQAGTGSEFVDRCKGVLADANELSDQSDDSGVTTAKIKNVKDLLAEFEELKPQPRAGAAIVRSATRRIAKLIASSSDLLQSRLDRLMVQFKKSQPDFFESYRAARKIVNQSASHETASGKITRVSVTTSASKAA